MIVSRVILYRIALYLSSFLVLPNGVAKRRSRRVARRLRLPPCRPRDTRRSPREPVVRPPYLVNMTWRVSPSATDILLAMRPP